MTAIDPRALRHAFGTFMTGVTIMTSHNALGEPIGFTANSFTSVSLDPPLLLVCLAKTSQNRDAFAAARGFAVNILAEDQITLSNTFARPAADRFDGVPWAAGPHGAPVLEGCAAWFDCTMHKTIDAGDHVILMGEVKAFDSTARPGLGYARGAYVTPAAEANALRQSTNLVVSALIEHAGKVLLVDDGAGGLGLPETIVTGDGATAAVRSLLAQTCPAAEPGFVYSVFEDVARKRQHISFLCQATDAVPLKGAFVPLRSSSFDDITDPAILTMLERFAAEQAIGSFGIYYGDQTRGEVRPLT